MLHFRNTTFLNLYGNTEVCLTEVCKRMMYSFGCSLLG